MTEAFARKLRQMPLACWTAAIAATLIFADAALFADTALGAETLVVRVDEAKISRLPDRVSTIVVGNPLIADVSLQQGGLMVLTGKGYGVTNLIALDRGGNVLSEQNIQVKGPNENIVVVYRGMERESYSCTPNCERSATLGDTPAFFEASINQASSRAARAQGAGTASSGPGSAPAR